MEQGLDKVVKDVMNNQHVTGCALANRQGLCIDAKGTATQDNTGMLAAIIEQANKLESNLNPPIVCLESGSKTVMIFKHGITGAIYKEIKPK